jgi:hypothetical protein
LEFINQLPIVNAHSEEIERHEIAAAMLQADKAVIDRHAAMFDEGLVKTADGKYQYNPKQWKAQKEHANKLLEKFRKKELTFEQFQEQMGNAPAAEPYNEEDVKNNPYARRIKAIIDARKDDESLEHMMRDIEEGDGVVKILDELAKEETKEATSDKDKEDARERSESFDFETAETSPVEAISSPSESVSTT